MSDATLLLGAWSALMAFIILYCSYRQMKFSHAMVHLDEVRQAHEEIRARALNYDELRDQIRFALAQSLGGSEFELMVETGQGTVTDAERWAWFEKKRSLTKEQIQSRINFGGIHDLVYLRCLPMSLLEPLRDLVKSYRPRDKRRVDKILLALSGYRVWEEVPESSADALSGAAVRRDQ